MHRKGDFLYIVPAPCIENGDFLARLDGACVASKAIFNTPSSEASKIKYAFVKLLLVILCVPLHLVWVKIKSSGLGVPGRRYSLGGYIGAFRFLGWVNIEPNVFKVSAHITSPSVAVKLALQNLKCLIRL